MNGSYLKLYIYNILRIEAIKKNLELNKNRSFSNESFVKIISDEKKTGDIVEEDNLDIDDYPFNEEDTPDNIIFQTQGIEFVNIYTYFI